MLLLLGLFFSIKGPDWVNRLGRPTLFSYDIDQYYSYLPAAFIQSDLSFAYEHNYWTQTTARGTELPKFTMGVAYLMAPWFGLAYFQEAAARPRAEITGYEETFDRWIHRGTLVYALLAAFFMLQALYSFFSPWIAAGAYLATFFGSNLFYYTMCQGEMAHSYLFMCMSLMIWATVRVHEKPRTIWLLLLGLSLGTAVVIRPSLALAVLFPLLYRVYDKESLHAKGQWFKSLGWRWIALLGAGMLPIVPLLFFWHYHTGQWLYYSYNQEQFFWNDPRLWEFLISYRKGWLLYTPLAFLMLLGLWPLWRHYPALRWSIPLMLVVVLYVVSCWWTWWYGGSFGQRVMVHYYAFLLFPLAALFRQAFAQPILKWALPLLLGVLVYGNIFQSRQYIHSILHYDGMTREAYWYVFGQERLSPEQYQRLEQLVQRPDYEAALQGKRGE